MKTIITVIFLSATKKTKYSIFYKRDKKTRGLKYEYKIYFYCYLEAFLFQGFLKLFLQIFIKVLYDYRQRFIKQNIIF